MKDKDENTVDMMGKDKRSSIRSDRNRSRKSEGKDDTG